MMPLVGRTGQAGGSSTRHAPRSRTHRLILVGSLSLAALPSALAASPFLDGAYGTKDGCIYHKTGQSSGADDFVLLDDDGITTSVSTCDFQGSATKTDKGFTIQAECEADGEAGSLETATLTRSAKGYTVTFPDGTKLGPIPKCP